MYPKNNYETLESPNPYVLNLEDALSETHDIVNKKPNRSGVLELYLYLFKADIFFFNWIEDAPTKRFGEVQFVALVIFLFLAKISRKKIIWVLHNKYSHEKKKKRWSKYIFEMMIIKSDLILTHSGEGIAFLIKEYNKYSKKAIYIIHPVESMLSNEIPAEKKYDILIWGTIHPYKGVIDFLKYMRSSDALGKLKIIISGICPDTNERKQLYELLSENIHYINSFQNIEEISRLASQSRYILFTYNSDSILSSGSLMDSIRMRTLVIGPEKGAFKDLKKYSFVKTYNHFDEIPLIIKSGVSNESMLYRDIEEFCIENSWKRFGQKLRKVSGGIL